jgi:hypothetical protein
MKRIVIAVVALLAVGLIAGCGTSSSGGSGGTSGGVTTGLGTKDASGDVTVGAVTNDSMGLSSAPVTVTNHSSGRSDYFITVVLDSADGTTQIDSTMVAVTNLEPGQTSPQTAQFTAPAPAGAVAKVTQVQRTASN